MSTNPSNKDRSATRRASVGKDELFELIEPVCADAGLELVDIEYSASLLRVYIDYPVDGPVDGSSEQASEAKAISFEECERISHELSALLDVEDAIAHKYNLEVSSPGIDRPLRTAAHFRRHLGQEAKIALKSGLDGRRNFKGKLQKLSDDGSLVTVDVDGTEFELPLVDLASAKLVPDWDALMSKGKKA